MAPCMGTFQELKRDRVCEVVKSSHVEKGEPRNTDEHVRVPWHDEHVVSRPSQHTSGHDRLHDIMDSGLQEGCRKSSHLGSPTCRTIPARQAI